MTNPALRILLCVHSAERGGAELMALETSRFLHARGHHLLIAVRDGPLQQEFAAHGSLTSGAPLLPLWGGSPRRWIGSLLRTMPAAVRIARTVEEHEIDVVLVNSSVLLAPALGARRARVPSVVHLRDWPASRLSRLVIAAQARAATRLVAISSETARLVPPSRRDRTVEIPDGIALGPEPAARQGFHDPLRLLVVGGLDPRKGQDVAIEAVATLTARGVPAELRLVGRETTPGHEADLRARCARLGVQERVFFAGARTDLLPDLDWADMLLVPSRGDFTPLSVMEALDRLVPVIAAPTGSLPELIHDGETGRMTNDLDPSSWADVVAEAARDAARTLATAERGRRLVGERFNRQRSLESLEEICLALAHRGGANRPVASRPAR